MATYYLRTDGSDSNAGTADTAGGAWRTIEHAAANVAAGDTVNVRGSAGNAASYPTSSLDYTISGFFTPTAGSTSAGYVRWLGLGTMPTIGTPGLGFNGCQLQWWEGLYFVATGATAPGFGMINGSGGECIVKECVINMNLQAGLIGLNLSGGEVRGTEVFGGGTSPTSSSGADGIECGNYGVLVQGCRVRHCRGAGIGGMGLGAVILNNLIYGCAGRGIDFAGNTTVGGKILGNTVHGNGSDGIGLTGTASAAWFTIRNNNLTGNGGYGLNVTDGSQSLNDARTRGCNYNNYGTGSLANTSGARANISAGANDLAVDPQYADASTGDFTPANTALQGAAFPVTFP